MNMFEIQNYGRITINLKTLLEKKSMSRNKLATKIQTSYELVNRYYSNKITRIDLDIMARMCYVLECDISDILKKID